MPQLSLFDSTETLLADDERGRITYAPRFVDVATADAWFAELRSGVEWRAERRMMYDREVAPHNDHLNEIRKGFPIALVSLGATRRMTIRAKEQPRRVIHVDVEAGSLLVMDYATQLHYTHG